MRTARAFIASVPLAIILVAALVVPLTVIPGTFGFDSWPSSHGASVAERQVRLPAPKVDIVAVRPRKPVPERHAVFVAERPRPTSPARTTVAVATRPVPVVHVSTPAPKPDPVRHHSSPQPAHPQPQRQPSPQPQSQPTKNELAGGDVPVAREQAPQETPAPQPAPAPAPAPQPAPVPPPVAQPAPEPVERVVPSEPCHGNAGEHGSHGNGHFGD